MHRSSNLHQSVLSAEEARHAIYIDFEKNQETAPTLLGILWQVGKNGCQFEQHVFEEAFRSSAEAKALGSQGANSFCVWNDVRNTLDWLLELADEGDVLVVGWSTFELDVFEETGCTGTALESLSAIYRNAIPTAKAYKSRCFPDFVFPEPTGFMPGGRNSLRNSQQMIGYPISTVAGPGLTGTRLSYIRAELLRKNCDYWRLTGTTKRKWTNLLGHNLHDCCSMREIMLRATDSYASPRPTTCGPCRSVGSEPICPE